jgi:hypothetical protein
VLEGGCQGINPPGKANRDQIFAFGGSQPVWRGQNKTTTVGKIGLDRRNLLAIGTIFRLDLQINYIDTKIFKMTAKSRLLMGFRTVDAMSSGALCKVISGVSTPVSRLGISCLCGSAGLN